MSDGDFIAQFKFNGDEERMAQCAKAAESAERHEDMCKFMSALVSKNPDLSVENRNLLSVAYKNVVGARRASWRTLGAAESERGHLAAYKTQLENELEQVCNEVLSLLNSKLIPASSSSKNSEANVFYLKMAGDYYRYLAEFRAGQGHDKKAAENYKQAMEKADALAPTHPIRLGLALNYSVCFYEILKEKQAACDLAKKAFDDAISKLDQLDEASYKDSTLIMQLLRDNLTLWTSDMQGDEKGGENDKVEVEES